MAYVYKNVYKFTCINTHTLNFLFESNFNLQKNYKNNLKNIQVLYIQIHLPLIFCPYPLSIALFLYTFFP